MGHQLKHLIKKEIHNTGKTFKKSSLDFVNLREKNISLKTLKSSNASTINPNTANISEARQLYHLNLISKPRSWARYQRQEKHLNHKRLRQESQKIIRDYHNNGGWEDTKWENYELELDSYLNDFK